MMMLTKTKHVIATESDLVSVRYLARKLSIELGFRLVDQTRIITAVSELTRNALIHAGGGFALLESLQAPGIGLKITITDKGGGIADVEQAMVDGFSTGRGMGNGLGGSKRLLDEFFIDTEVGKGTTIVGIKWLH